MSCMTSYDVVITMHQSLLIGQRLGGVAPDQRESARFRGRHRRRRGRRREHDGAPHPPGEPHPGRAATVGGEIGTDG